MYVLYVLICILHQLIVSVFMLSICDTIIKLINQWSSDIKLLTQGESISKLCIALIEPHHDFFLMDANNKVRDQCTSVQSDQATRALDHQILGPKSGHIPNAKKYVFSQFQMKNSHTDQAYLVPTNYRCIS